MKIGYCYKSDTDGMYKLTVDKDAVTELIKVSERNAKTAVQGDRYDDAEEALAARKELKDLLKEPEVPALDSLLTE